MRTTSVLRFLVLGAVGFGLGAAVGTFLFPFGIPLGGAVGGASLGLALRDFGRAVILAGLGALGLLVGVFAGVTLGAGFFNYAAVPIAAVVGAVVAALLGAAFRDWRTNVALAVAGAVGFGAGYWLINFMRASIPILRQLGEGGSIIITGIIGGAFLGAALGYLEDRRLAAGRRPRVR